MVYFPGQSSPFKMGLLYPLYTGGLFHCYMLIESICTFRHVESILSLKFYFRWEILLANNVDPDQTPHDVASDLGLQCLPMTLFLGFQVRMAQKSNFLPVRTDPMRRETRKKMTVVSPESVLFQPIRRNFL